MMSDPASFEATWPDPGPPHSLEAERSVLGAILLDNAQLARVLPIVTSEDFYRESHRRILRAMERLAGSGRPIDPVTLKETLSDSGDLAAAGGLAYLTSLLDGVPRCANAVYHSAIVAEKARRRRAQCSLAVLMPKITNGVDTSELIQHLRDAEEALAGPSSLPRAVHLHSAAVRPEQTEFSVSNLIRRKGLHLLWAPPGGLKTYGLLRWIHELLAANPLPLLTGHPELEIRRSYTRVLWIATEEDAGGLRYRADAVKLGLGKEYEMGGELLYLFAADSRRRLTLDDLPSIIEAEGPLDAVVLDSLTGLRPKVKDGQRVKWDLDNDAANEQCLVLRGLAVKHSLAIVIVHHTGRDQGKGYRGPTDWWASADVMLGLVPERDMVKVQVEKNRDGKLIEPFYLTPSWGPSGFYLAYTGAVPRTAGTLTGIAKRADEVLQQKGEASQASIEKALDCARSSVQKAVRQCLEAGLWEATGRTEYGSMVYRRIEVEA